MTDTLTPRTVTWLTSLANAALVVLLGISGALLMLDLLPLEAPSASGGPTLVPNTQQQAAPSSPTRALGDQIASAHLFGQASAKKAVAPVTPRPSNAPKTKLNLTLSGVLAFEPQDRSLAIIRVGGGPEQVFAIGDPVGSRAVLKAVYSDKAIIEHNNTLETLPLPRDSRADQGLSLSSNQPVRNNIPSPVQNTPAISNLPTTPRQLRERLVREPQLMGKLMRVAPYQQNGTTIGYQLTPKQGADILQNYGIYPGDVVTSLNGVSLTSQRRGLNAMRRLVNAKNLEMTVLRNGVEVPVSISFE